MESITDIAHCYDVYVTAFSSAACLRFRSACASNFHPASGTSAASSAATKCLSGSDSRSAAELNKETISHNTSSSLSRGGTTASFTPVDGQSSSRVNVVGGGPDSKLNAHQTRHPSEWHCRYALAELRSSSLPRRLKQIGSSPAHPDTDPRATHRQTTKKRGHPWHRPRPQSRVLWPPSARQQHRAQEQGVVHTAANRKRNPRTRAPILTQSRPDPSCRFTSFDSALDTKRHFGTGGVPEQNMRLKTLMDCVATMDGRPVCANTDMQSVSAWCSNRSALAFGRRPKCDRSMSTLDTARASLGSDAAHVVLSDSSLPCNATSPRRSIRPRMGKPVCVNLSTTRMVAMCSRASVPTAHVGKRIA